MDLVPALIKEDSGKTFSLEIARQNGFIFKEAQKL